MEKWTQSLDEENYQILKTIADKRKIAVPELIRAVVVPEWMEWKLVMKR